jgi:hypothetical protein
MNRYIRLSLLFILGTAIGLSQSITSLSGRVTDPTGAAIAGAVVEITNIATDAKRRVVSDSAGLYAFNQVTPGDYRVTAIHPGFSTETIQKVTLVVSSPSTIAIKLNVGAVSETVSVSSASVQVNTTDASIGNAITEKPIQELPFEARNPVGLLALQPGVTYIPTGDYRSGSVNGGKSDQGNVTLDGVDVNDQQFRTAFTSVLRVTLDSVQEFRVTTANSGADGGRSSGAQVSLVTKSGTNMLHASAYEYNRNTITEANDFFSNQAGVDRARLNRNIFGATAGGPIKKDKLFIFGNFEERKDASAATATRIVPNALYRQGIFTYIRKDGSTGQLTPAQITANADPLHIGPNAAILKYLQMFPVSNSNAVGDGLNTAGYTFNSGKPLTYKTYITKIDYVLNSKNTMFARGNLQNDHFTEGIPQFPGQQDSSAHLENSKGVAVGDTMVITPNLVSNMRYGLTRQSYDSTGVQATPYVTLRSIDNLYPTTRSISATIPTHTIADDFSWNKGAHTMAFGANFRYTTAQRLNFANSFSSGFINSSWLQGTGSNLLVADAKNSTLYTRLMTDLLGIVSQGTANYNYDKSGNVLPEGAGIQRKFIDKTFETYVQDTWKVNRALTVVAGLRASFSPALAEANGIQTTTNIPLSDWFNQRGALGDAGKPQSSITPISFDLSSKPGGRPLYPFQHTYSPRLGLAYSPQFSDGLLGKVFGGSGKTSIRAGAGLYYDVFGQSLIRLVDSTALGFSTQLTNPANASVLTSSRFQGPTTLPAGLLIPAPKGGFPQTAPNIWAIARSVDDKIKSPYTINLNFSVERQLSESMIFQMAYVAKLSRRSIVGDDVAIPTNLRDPASGQTYFQAATLMQQQVAAGVPTSKITKQPFFENFYPGYATKTLNATQSIYDQFYLNEPDATSVLLDIDGPGCSPCGKSGAYQQWNSQYSSLAVYRSRASGSYHSMQLTLRKRFTQGLQFDFNYTYSRSIDLASTRESDGVTSSQIINPWNTRQMRAVSDYDLTHNITAFAIYELPIGKGKRFAGNSNKVVDAFIGGWQLTGIYRQSSGFPVSVGNGGFWPTNWNISGYATQLNPLNASETKNATVKNGGPYLFSNPNSAFNDFALTLPGQTGSRNTLRGDGIFNIDSSLGKVFTMPYNERHKLQLRGELFNVTNTTRFDVNTISLSVGAPNTFGKYSSTLSTPRVMQIGMKYSF